MPRFEPFAGLRYDTARVDLSMVICPPYDVIGPEERARLVSRHSANAVRVELPEPDHRAGLDRYDSAANQLLRWQDEGILVRDPAPALYAYRMVSPERPRHQRGHRRPRDRRRERGGDLPPRGDPAQGQDRPARPARRHPGQPVPHLGALPHPRAHRDLRPHGDPPGARRWTGDGVTPPAVGRSRTADAIRAVEDAVERLRRWSWPTATTGTRRPGPTAQGTDPDDTRAPTWSWPSWSS